MQQEAHGASKALERSEEDYLDFSNFISFFLLEFSY
jgi:hypothetical protein